MVILLLAAFTRMPYLFTGSYTHDELSALYRVQVPHFTDLFSHKGLTDAHPPLVQVFLYAYTSLFGSQEWVVRLPFVLMGLLSIYLVYRIGKKYYSKEAGLFTAAIMAVSQLFIFHSLVARPYSPGLFFVLLFTEKWLQCFYDQATTRKNIALYILYGWLAFFTHHFCTLHIFLLVVLGVFAIQKKQWRAYIRVNILLLLVSLPVFYIIMFQLQFKGIGSWLNSPEPDYLLKFFRYLFHYNFFYLWTVVGFTLIAGFFYFRQQPNKTRLYIPVLVAVFLMVYLAAYCYSVYRAPLLQFSLLQFSLPFFLLGVFQVFGVIRNSYFTGIIIGIFVVLGLIGLYYNRANDELMRSFPYKALSDFSRPYQEKNVLIVTSDRPEFIKRYMPVNKLASTYGKDHPVKIVSEIVLEKNPGLVVSANNDFATYSMLRSYYPFVIDRKESFLNNFFVLSKTSSAQSLQPEGDGIPMPIFRQKAHLNPAVRYFPLVDTSVNLLGRSKKTQFWFRARVRCTEMNPATLVFEIHQGDSLKFWYGNELYVRTDTVNAQSCFATFDFSQELKKAGRKNVHIKLYLWNNHGLNSEFTGIEWGLMEPNFKFYGLTEDFK